MTPQQAKDSAEYFYSCAAAENPCESVRCSYLAAVKGAGILIARHPRLARTRPLTRDVWTLLARLSPEWDDDIAYFRQLAKLRRDIEMGLPVAISANTANEVFHRVGIFLDRVDASCEETQVASNFYVLLSC